MKNRKQYLPSHLQMEELSHEKMRKHPAHPPLVEDYELPNGHPGARGASAESPGRPVSMYEPRQWKQRQHQSPRPPAPDPPGSPIDTPHGTADSHKSRKVGHVINRQFRRIMSLYRGKSCYKFDLDLIAEFSFYEMLVICRYFQVINNQIIITTTV